MKINFKTRQLIRSATRGFLSTELNPKNFKNIQTRMSECFSYSTFTLTAFDYDLSPIILLSDLSEHTKNILEKNSSSLMLCEERKLYNFFPKFKTDNSSYEDPMSRPRVTLIGKIKKTKNKNHKMRFLQRHPASNLYANFRDMNFYKMEIKSAHLIGGFAHVKWFSDKELVLRNIKNFEEYEQEIISHMNSCHKKSIELYVKNLMKDHIKSNENKGKWDMIGIDPDGFDLRKKENVARFFFKNEIFDAKKIRGIFVRLHKESNQN